ncbi:MAG: hypothetical protein HYW91_02790 [Candidatus Sungbacteria bacterium]|nr:hypothetical protein [Candidatus Sungbacteria bacterium]
MWYRNIEEFKAANGHEVNGTWYPRVTKILDIKSKPALDGFFKEMESYASAEEVKNKSAAEGSLMHAVIQKIAVGDVSDIPEEVLPAADAFLKFNDGAKIVFHPEFIEKQIWSPRHRYAGTVDALASIGGKFGVLDIKTSTGFYPEYNLQTAAYASALQEFQVKKTLELPRDIETRWILRVNQHKICRQCKATLREKGGRSKIRLARRSFSEGGNGKVNGGSICPEGEHKWGEMVGEAELREFPYFYKDIRAFVAAKILWEWENDYWLRQIGYLKNDNGYV